MLGKSNSRNLSAVTEDITLEENEHCKKESRPSIDQFRKKRHSVSHPNMMKEEV